jgi:LmbE family N-acetylglucosaminyl deacetylase
MTGLHELDCERATALFVIAPHPDDDVLGCGSLIARAAERLPVTVIYVTDGAASHHGSPTYPPERLREVRRDEAQRGLRALHPGAGAMFLDWPDGNVPRSGDPDAGPLLDALRAQIPDDREVAVAMPWRRDHHADHVAVATLVDAVLRERPRAARIEYTVWLGILGEAADEPQPAEGRTIELDARPWLARKRAAIDEHASQRGTLILDAAQAFVLPDDLLARALGPVERYVVANPQAASV